MRTIISVMLTCIVTTILLQGCATAPVVSKSPEDHYKDGEMFFKKGKYEQAVESWKMAKESYQSPELTAKAEIGIADAYFMNHDYIEAAAAYEDFRKLHPRHERAGYALFRQGLSYYNQISHIETEQTPVKNAVATLESYLKLYPAGEHTAEVQDKVRDCKDKQLQYEIYIGRFYLRNDKYPAAIARFEEASKRFPGAQRQDEVLYYLGRACFDGYQKEKGAEAFEKLLREFPSSRYASEARKALDKK